jgi:hypothetical protein
MFSEGILALAIPLGLCVVLPIVAILTAHQRKMAEIYARTAVQQPNPEISQLRDEIRELKMLVHQQAIALDSYPAARTTEQPAQQDLRVGGL